MADNSTIARPYARAAFAVARENDALDELSRSLGIAKEHAGRRSGVDGSWPIRRKTNEERLQFLTDLFAKTAGEDSVLRRFERTRQELPEAAAGVRARRCIAGDR